MAENYGLTNQYNIQNLQAKKRPSAGFVENYKNNTHNVNMNAIPNIPNVQYKQKKVHY